MGVKERYEERKKKGKTAIYSGVRERSVAKEIDGIASSISERTNTWLKNHSNYLTNYNDRYSGRKGSYEDSYVSDASDWLSTISAQKENFDKESTAILSMLDEYGDYLDKNWANSIRGTLKTASKYQEKILKSAESDSKFWSKYPTEADYRKDVDAYRKYAQTGEAVTFRQNTYKENAKKISELEALLDDIKTFGDDGFQENNRKIVEVIKQYGSVDGLEAEIDRLKTENNLYERGEGGYTSKTEDDYYAVMQSPEYTMYAKSRDYRNPDLKELEYINSINDVSKWSVDENGDYYGPDGTTKIIRDENGNYIHPYMLEADLTVEDKLGYYLSMEGDQLSRGLMTPDSGKGTSVWHSVYSEGVNGSWKQLTEDEIGIYYTLLKTKGQDAAYRFLDDMKTVLNKRETTEVNIKNWKNQYSEANALGKILLNLDTIPQQLQSSIGGFIEDTSATIRGEGINPYSAAHQGMRYSSTVRGEAAADLDKTGIKIPGLGFSLGDAYQSVMSIGDSMVSMALGGPTVGGLLLATGAAENEAYRLYQQGASNEQVVLGAAAAGAMEMVFERISLGELNKIKNMKSPKTIGQFFKTLLVQGGVEMSEEMATEIGNLIANTYIMGSQSDWEQKLKDNGGNLWAAVGDEAIEVLNAGIGGFISGVGSGAIVGGASYIGNKRQNNQQESAKMTENEQKVVDRYAEELIAEREKGGKKLSNKEKARIREQAASLMEKGYISTDTIEKVLGGEEYSAYEKLQAEYEEFKKLYETETGKQNDRLSELKKKNDANSYESALQAAKEKLSQNVYGLVKNERLSESYNERARMKQRFTADLNRYSEKQRAVVKSAMDSGILNNTNKTHDFVDLIAKLSAEQGVPVDFTNNQKLKESGFGIEGKTIDGYVTKDGITLNINSHKALNYVVGHEITHVLEGTKLYTQLQAALTEYAKAKGDYKSRRANIEELYRNVKDADIDAELTADMVGDYLFSDPEFVRNLSVNHRNVFLWLRDEIKYLLKQATAGSDEARKLEKAEKIFDDMYRKGGKNTLKDGEVKLSLTIKHTDGSVEELADARSLTDEQALKYLQQAKSGALQRRTYIPVRKDTPQVVIDTLAQVNDTIEDRSLVMQVAKAQQAMSQKDNSSNRGGNKRGHKLTPEQIVEIMNNLDDPSFAVYQTNRTDNYGNSLPNNVAFFVEHNKNGTEAVAIIEFDSEIDPGAIGTEFGETKYHTVVTVFEPDMMRNGIEYDYAEELLSNSNNTMLEIVRKQPAQSATGEKSPNTSSKLLSTNMISEKSEKSSRKNKYSISEANEMDTQNDTGSVKKLSERVSGDALLDAEDLIDEIKSVGGQVDDNGYVTLYHRTTKQAKEKILSSGKMTGKEDGIFFSTKENGQAVGYGDSVIEMRIPAEKLVLDDIFDDEAHLRYPLANRNAVLDVSEYITPETRQYSLSNQTDTDDIAPLPGNVYGKDIALETAPVRENGAVTEEAPVRETVQEKPVSESLAGMKTQDTGTGAVTDGDIGPVRKQRTEQDKLELVKKQFAQQKSIVSNMSPERQKYLADKYEKHRIVLEQLEKGDNLVDDNGNIIGTVRGVYEEGISIIGEDGFVELIPKGTFSGDSVISFLETGDGHFEKPDGTRITGTSTEIDGEKGSATESSEDIGPVRQDETIYREEPIPARDGTVDAKQQGGTSTSAVSQNTDGAYTPAEIELGPTAGYQAAEIGPVRNDAQQTAEAAPVRQDAPQQGEAVPTGTKAQTNHENPKEKQRKWVETSTESEPVNRQILPDNLDQSVIHYQPISNETTLGNANAMMDRMGYDTAVSYFNSQFANRKVSLDDIALGERLIQEAVKRKDFSTAGELIQNVAILGTELGQKVQALSIIQRLTPEGQLKMLQKIVERGKAKGDKAFEGVEITPEMEEKILDVYDEGGNYDPDKLNEAVENVKQQIADQMGVSILEKVNAWRYLSMLGNPKTHIRNIVSNIAMKATVSVKNAIARTVESIAPIKSRTKTWKPASEAVKAYARKTAEDMKDVISGDSKISESASIKEKRAIFKNKILNKLYDINSDWLSKEDWWFSKSAFQNSLQEFLTANGIETEADIKNNPKIVQKGISYATEQSQIATFRQYSWLANKINDIQRKNAATDIVVGAILPFKKTPINIAKTGLNYSPLGFAKTLTYDLSQVKKGKMEASTLIDHLAQNTTGTALTLIGYMLASIGILNGSGDDDKEAKYDYQLGKQSYSVNIGGSTFSLSWLSPVAMPLFVGANAYEHLTQEQEWNGDVVIQALAETLDPLSEMSFLSSLDSVLSSYDSGVKKFVGIGEAMIQSYASQFIPTVSSQFAATLDDTKRSTKVAGDSGFEMFDRTINQLKYKIPFLRETLEPSTDIWGNELKQSENVITRAVENFIAPYSRKDSIATEIDEEIKNLYAETGDNGIIPAIPDNYVNYKGGKYEMSASEYTAYKKTYGQTASALLEDLFATDTYKNATSEARAKMVNRVYDYARDEAKREYLAKEGVQYTNATKDKVEYYKEDSIKGAIENDMTVDEYEFYVDNPGKYAVSKAVGGYEAYKTYSGALYDIKSDKDKNGDSISESRKKKVIEYINNLDADYGEKIILYKSEYPGDDRYNAEIVDYLNSRDDISYDEMVTILTELGFRVLEDGTVRW